VAENFLSEELAPNHAKPTAKDEEGIQSLYVRDNNASQEHKSCNKRSIREKTSALQVRKSSIGDDRSPIQA